jgi:hypothetical protein
MIACCAFPYEKSGVRPRTTEQAVKNFRRAPFFGVPFLRANKKRDMFAELPARCIYDPECREQKSIRVRIQLSLPTNICKASYSFTVSASRALSRKSK